MKNVLYMAVTADALEMPVACAETIGELARLLGKSYASVSTSMHRQYSGKRNGFKIVRVVFDPHEGE